MKIIYDGPMDGKFDYHNFYRLMESFPGSENILKHHDGPRTDLGDTMDQIWHLTEQGVTLSYEHFGLGWSTKIKLFGKPEVLGEVEKKILSR